jgi:hypothetical protein
MSAAGAPQGTSPLGGAAPSAVRGKPVNAAVQRWRSWLWWLTPFAALALLLGIETDWGRGIQPMPGPAPVVEPKPVTVALLPEYRVEGGLAAHTETVNRTLFNPTRRPAPAPAAAARSSMPKGQFLLTGTAVAGERHIAFLKEVASGKSRVVRQGEQINGVLVAAVTADRVRFTQGDESEELILRVAAGPKTTTPPPPPPGAPVPATAAPLPGAVRPAGAPAADPATMPPPARRALPTGGPASSLPAAVLAPAAPAPVAPATSSTPAAGQGAPASPDPVWNEVYERMRQRGGGAPPAK